MDECFGFTDEIDEIIFVDVAGEHEVYDGAVEAIGELAYEIYFLDFTEAFDDGVDDGIKADVFDEDIVDLVVERMVGVGLEKFLVAFGACFEHAGFFEAVEFLADGVGGVAKFGFEAPEVGTGTAVEEELEQKFDPCFGRNEGFDHRVSLLIE